MATNLTETVLCAIPPRTFMRPCDVAESIGVDVEAVYPHLKELSKGGGD